ncbi:sodium:calcium antiporter [Halopiger djelfimassiliensis]|uniref:sodium:calcium antiporter n=1 Tax=Halopiger djelfimassiliensis TaxID=1293047 RepID=UPI0006777769|nr:sodium:proton exchanger [Halopiger djelfimassiliensis]
MSGAGLPIAFFLVLFLLGVLLVIWCVEVFIEAVARSAVSLGISGFFLAVLLAGVDLENAVLGLTAAFVALPDLALGTVFGESLFVLAVGVGVAGLVAPFESAVPRIYLLMLLFVPIPAFAMSLGGTIDLQQGVLLVAAFVPLLAAIFWYERRSRTAYMRSEEVQAALETDRRDDGTEPVADSTTASSTDATEGETVGTDRDDSVIPTLALDFDLDADEFVPDLEERSGTFALGVAILSIVGLTAGSLLTVASAERLFVAFGISGLAFGATVLSFIASIEELALTVEPVRKGRPHLAVGNVVGSTVFYMTANVGLIALLHPVDTGGAVLSVHWPFFAGCLLVVTVMLARNRVTRGGGVVLVGLYVAYWVANYA